MFATNISHVFCAMGWVRECFGILNLIVKDTLFPCPKSRKGDENCNLIQAEGVWFPNDVCYRIFFDQGWQANVVIMFLSISIIPLVAMKVALSLKLSTNLHRLLVAGKLGVRGLSLFIPYPPIFKP